MDSSSFEDSEKTPIEKEEKSLAVGNMVSSNPFKIGKGSYVSGSNHESPILGEMDESSEFFESDFDEKFEIKNEEDLIDSLLFQSNDFDHSSGDEAMQERQ